MINLIDLLGRVLISLVFLLSGYNKIFNYSNTVSWMEGYGVPGFLLWPTIVLEIILPILNYKFLTNSSYSCLVCKQQVVYLNLFCIALSNLRSLLDCCKNITHSTGITVKLLD